MKRKNIYMDYASITPIDPKIAKRVHVVEKTMWHNPSSIHAHGVAAKHMLDEARERVAKTVHCRKDEVIFTGSGTEASNLAIIGVVRAAKKRGMQPQVVLTRIEHPATSFAAQRAVEDAGGDAEVHMVDVGSDGLIDLQALKLRITPQTVLVSVIHANNEIGTVQDVRAIKRFLDTYKKALGRSEQDYPYLHIDAAQSPNYLSINRDALGADLITLDAGKIYGPRGCGCLCVRHNVPLDAVIVGGGQEKGLRSGTENLPAIVGFSHALVEAQQRFEKDAKHMVTLRDTLAKGILKIAAESGRMAHVNGVWNEGDYASRIANNVNVCIEDMSGELLVLRFDAHGIAISAASSCKHLDDDARSIVVEALGDPACAASSLRFTLGRGTTLREIKDVLAAAKTIFATK